MTPLVGSAPPVAIDSGMAELVLLVAGIVFTLAVAMVFGTVIVRAVRAERRADEERRRLRERFQAEWRDEVGERAEGDAAGSDGEEERP